jgi:hypothetical protein
MPPDPTDFRNPREDAVPLRERLIGERHPPLPVVGRRATRREPALLETALICTVVLPDSGILLRGPGLRCSGPANREEEASG